MEDYWDEPLVGEHTLRPAHDDLQGAWLTISGRREAVFLISGNHFTVRFSDGDIYMGIFEIHPATLPKRMVMRIEEGPPRHKGKTTWCIYELDGHTLRWCAGSPGQVEQLNGFPVEDDPQYLCLRLRREQPV
jgi:uncharacterized protein (TIGR03067 family)